MGKQTWLCKAGVVAPCSSISSDTSRFAASTHSSSTWFATAVCPANFLRLPMTIQRAAPSPAQHVQQR